jgi:hypothetical protein
VRQAKGRARDSVFREPNPLLFAEPFVSARSITRRSEPRERQVRATSCQRASGRRHCRRDELRTPDAIRRSPAGSSRRVGSIILMRKPCGGFSFYSGKGVAGMRKSSWAGFYGL